MPDDASPLLERKLATILSADVASYSRLMAEDEEQTLRVFAGHRQVFESLVATHRGRIFNTAGDAILAEFPSAVEAVRCATEIQTALHTRNGQLPEQRQVKFRIGVNLGDVMVQNGDLLGDGVNVAARLQAAAEPGGICISGSVYDQIRNKLSLSFRSLGERSFKNIPQPVRTFSITETEDHGRLPASHRDLGRLLKWAALVGVLVLVIGGGYWAYTKYQSGILAARREARLAVQRAEARVRAEEQMAREADAARRAEIARQQAAVETRRRDLEDRRLSEMQRLSDPARAGESQRNPIGVAGPAAPPGSAGPPTGVSPGGPGTAPGQRGDAVATLAPSDANTGAGAAARAPGSTGSPGIDGMYAGPVCLGDSRFDAARCYRAQAAVTQGKVSGQWPTRDPGITTYLWGDVSASGDATLRLQTRKPDGSPMATANLTGKLADGRLDATGTFLNGRSIQLNWRKN